MYKIKFIPTGNIFLIPEEEAKMLKSKNPDEYLILEKNGRKVKDKLKSIIKNDEKSVLSKVLDK